MKYQVRPKTPDEAAGFLVEQLGKIAEDMALKAANHASLYDEKLEAKWDAIHRAIVEARP